MFRNRRDAGHRLAQALSHYRDARGACILGLPRGGVIIGDELSQQLHLPLEVMITRKLGAPGNPELAMGALTETGYCHLNDVVIRQYGVSERHLKEEIRRQEEEISRQVRRYRNGKALPSLCGQTVIVVDDGLATGATFFASLAALRALTVGRLVAAIPVAPAPAAGELKSTADEVVILATPQRFYAIGLFYEDFSQLDDEEVIACLARGRTHALDD